MQQLQIWGGVECSVNRISDTWQDQLELTGHAHRIEDLELIAELGITTLRYPILWERCGGTESGRRDWAWADRRLRRLRDLGIDPIVGFVHHGSGPAHTDLLADNFVTGLAGFAADFAARYPWVNRYTPINEPLTTARFSALYGLWYPHHRDNHSFARALMNQCRGIALSMTEIWRINPQAELVQTEDLGTTFGTPHMAYQQRFDNERRWLTWDILFGRVDERHCLHRFLEESGISRAELNWFVTNPSPPQILGINHYVTSDRYLDEQTRPYPSQYHGTNAIEPYADVEAVRVYADDLPGWNVIQDAWDRYRIPIALTEVHLGCTREEQVRWLEGARRGAIQARERGCDVRAITAWSLFGAYHWSSLLTRRDQSYEAGAFDVRGSQPRPTAVATLIREWTSGREAHSHLAAPGWWQRPDKAIYRTHATGAGRSLSPPRWSRRTNPLLICGARGALGRAMVSACESRNLSFRALLRSDLDITCVAAVRAACEQFKPWALINAAGFVRVDEAEHSPEPCWRENLEGAAVLGGAADARGIPFLTFSSDLVFDGHSASPYVETSTPRPLNVYGASKRSAELATLVYARTLCVRTAAFFGASTGGDFLRDVISALCNEQAFAALDDVTVSPTYLPDLADASLDLLIDGCTGLVHLANRGALTWAAFATRGAEALELRTRDLILLPQARMDLLAARPKYSALASERVNVMPTLDDAIARFARNAQSLTNGRLSLLRAHRHP